MASGVNIRRPAVAGSFYPGDKGELTDLLRRFFHITKRVTTGRNITALILPHAGYVYSGQTAAWGFRQLPEGHDQRFVLIGPTHHFSFRGLAASGIGYWETPLGRVGQTVPGNLPDGIFLDERPHVPEHSLEVQLPYLQYLCGVCSVSCFLTGTSVNAKAAAAYFLKEHGSEVLLVSSDLSHYLSRKEAMEKDKKTIDATEKGDMQYFLSEDNSACGRWGILIALAAAATMGWKKKLISYDTSATFSGDTSAVVGYAAIAFYE